MTFRNLTLVVVLAALLGSALSSQSAEAQQSKPKPTTKGQTPSSPTPTAQPGASGDAAPVAPKAATSAPADGGAPSATQVVPGPEIAFQPATAQELALGYPLGVGDVVRVVVFQQPDMTTETRVSETGTITVPLLGPVPVGGVTAKRAEDRIAALLKSRGFVREPQVTVTVLQFKSRQVSVLGLVSKPGRYTLEEGIYRLIDVLALAGGALPDGSDLVTLVRVVDGKSQRYEIDLPSLFRSGDVSKNPEILTGDSIYVARAPQFYIYGEVQRPGTFKLESNMSVMQALAVAGGVTLRGTAKNMRLNRRDAKGSTITITPDMNDLVQPNDVIFVRESMF
jgi:polysaccharide export outer membrane protein